MIELTQGNLLVAPAEALVNTVNTVGVMGKGIALQFKRAFPDAYKEYVRACKAEDVQLGTMHVVDLGGLTEGPRWIVNFPTKKHWKSKSRIEDITNGLQDLVRVIRKNDIRSIAVPPLGCGHGGLSWQEVRPAIEAALGSLTDVRVLLYPPAGTPDASSMPDRTDRPDMTPGRAALILAMKRYLDGLLDPCITLLEVHKLMYLLQEAGQKLDLQYTKGTYGPYAVNMRHVLSRVEGHFITGFGDGSERPGIELGVLPGAARSADEYVTRSRRNDLREHLSQVSQLIRGFEDPQGMELLCSVHWVATHYEESPATLAEVIQSVHDWSERKRRVLKPEAIKKASYRLIESGWMESVL